MSTSTRLVPAAIGPATELIQQIEAQGFKTRTGKSLKSFAAWRRLKRQVRGLERAVGVCWKIIREVRAQIKDLSVRQKRARAVEIASYSSATLDRK